MIQVSSQLNAVLYGANYNCCESFSKGVRGAGVTKKVFKPKLLKSGELVKDKEVCLWIWRWKWNTFPGMGEVTPLRGGGLSYLLDVYKLGSYQLI